MATPVTAIAPRPSGGAPPITSEPAPATCPCPPRPFRGRPALTPFPFRAASPASLTAFKVPYLPAAAGVGAVKPSHLRLIPVAILLATAGHLRDKRAGAKEISRGAKRETPRASAGAPARFLLSS